MKASVFLGKEIIKAQQLEMPVLRPGEVLVRVLASGICGTDVHIYYGMPGATDPTVPVVLGHEFSGEVVACGANVSRVKIGDLVTVDPNMYCGNCDACHNGKKQYCDAMSAIGVNQNGGFAQFCAVPEAQAIVVRPGTDPEEAAFGEPVACCLHGVDNIGIAAGDTVCVVGGGAIGQIMCQLARLSGASCVVLSEPVEMRRALALSLGADAAIDPMAGDLNAQMQEKTGRSHADVVIECVGKPVAVEQSVQLAARGGRILIFSVPEPGATAALPLSDVFKKELTIKGSFVNPDTQLRAAALISAGRLKLKPLITHRYPVDRLEEAIAMQLSDASVKVMILPQSEA